MITGRRYSDQANPWNPGDGKSSDTLVSAEQTATGTTMRDYLRVPNPAHILDEIVALYDDGTGLSGELQYREGFLFT